MNSYTDALRGKRVAVALLIIVLLVGMVPNLTGGSVGAQSPQAILNIDLGATPAQVSIIGAADEDHLSGNSGPGVFNQFPRAHAIAVGDFNRDNIQDIAIGAPDADFAPQGGTARAGNGAVYIIFGRTNLSTPPIIDANTNQISVKVLGAASGDNLGFALAAGDVNGDGGDDLLIGAPGADFPGTGNPPTGARADTGAVFVILGATTLTPRTIDLNDANSSNIAIFGERSGDSFGSDIAVGDVGGATVIADVLIGAPGNDGPNNDRGNSGAAYLLFGGAGFTPVGTATLVVDLAATAAAARIFGRAGSLLGSAVAIGDVNAGNAGDLIVGAPLDDRPSTPSLDESGAVHIIFGGSNLVPVAPATTRVFDVAADQQSASVYGANAGDHLGADVAAGNVAGDSSTDLVIGAPDADGPNDTRDGAGEVYVITGSQALPVRTDIGVNAVSLTIFGAAAGDHAGSTVAVGRVNTLQNTDVIADLLVGSPGFNFGTRANAGMVSLFFGGGSLLQFPARDLALGQDDIRVIGEAANDELGWAIAAGDVDNNTGGDLIVGAPFNDPVVGQTTRTNAGKVYVLLAANEFIPPVNQNPTVSVTAPNGGETIQGGATVNIQWTANDPNGENTIQRFEIRLSTDGGATFNFVIATNVPNTPGVLAESFAWTVPIGLNTTMARIRVIAFDNTGLSGQDDSNANFTISDQGAITVTAPNGGEVLRFGQQFQITWTVPAALAGQIVGFDLFLSTNGGTTFNQSITPFNPLGPPALGADVRSFTWTVPSICTNQARVLVRATTLSGTQTFDASNANFTIAGPGPTIDITDLDLNDDITKLIIKTTDVTGGTRVNFTQDATVEISTDEAGTTFVSFPRVSVNNSGTKIKARGTPSNGQSLATIIPDGAIRLLRITNPPCGVIVLRVRREGSRLVVVPATQSSEVWN